MRTRRWSHAGDPDDVARLQALLDESCPVAAPHLASNPHGTARLTAEELVVQLRGMQVFVVATTTRDGRPRTGPVNCFLYRGYLPFGTAKRRFLPKIPSGRQPFRPPM